MNFPIGSYGCIGVKNNFHLTEINPDYWKEFLVIGEYKNLRVLLVEPPSIAASIFPMSDGALSFYNINSKYRNCERTVVTENQLRPIGARCLKCNTLYIESIPVENFICWRCELA